LLLGSTASVHAQMTPRLDLAVSYIAQDSLKASSSQNFWSQGGSVELGANVWRGLGIAADVTGTHAGSIGSSGIPLSMVTVTFGPRYRWYTQKKLSLYGEALLGEASGFRSLFPSASGSRSDANSMALQIGGGADYRLNKRFDIRLLDAAWLRTQFPNGTDNVQNNLHLGVGVVVRFGR
jgi:predicted porin